MDGFVSEIIEDEKIFNYKTVLVVKGRMEFQIYTFTECAKQLIELVKSNIDFNDEYFLEICNELRRENRNIQINAYKIESIDQQDIIFNEENDLLLNRV